MRKAFDEVLSDDFSMGIIYNRGERL